MTNSRERLCAMNTPIRKLTEQLLCQVILLLGPVQNRISAEAIREALKSKEYNNIFTEIEELQAVIQKKVANLKIAYQKFADELEPENIPVRQPK